MSHISIHSVFSSAWEKLHGSKSAIWSIAIVILLIMITLAYLSNIIVVQSQTHLYWLNHIILPIILYLFIGPFYGGSFIVAIKRFRDESVNIKTGHHYLRRFFATAITMVIVGMISNLAPIVINIPTIAQDLGRRLPYFDLLGGLFSLLVYTTVALNMKMQT